MKKIKIEDITPDLILELERQAEDLHIVELTVESLKAISQTRQGLIDQLNLVEAQCKIRCIRAFSLGFSKKDLAEIFNVTTREITKWIGK